MSAECNSSGTASRTVDVSQMRQKLAVLEARQIDSNWSSGLEVSPLIQDECAIGLPCGAPVTAFYSCASLASVAVAIHLPCGLAATVVTVFLCSSGGYNSRPRCKSPRRTLRLPTTATQTTTPNNRNYRPPSPRLTANKVHLSVATVQWTIPFHASAKSSLPA